MKNITFMLIGIVLSINSMLGQADARITFYDPGMHTFVITNLGDATINVAGHYVCNYPQFNCIAALLVLEGSMTLTPGSSCTVYWAQLDGMDGEFGYFYTNNFFSSTFMLDYFQWGSGGHQHESIAVEAGFWNAGDFIPDDQPHGFVGSSGDYGLSYWEAAAGNVRITEVDTEKGTIELTNKGTLDQAIGGWYFCRGNQFEQVASAYCLVGDFLLSPGESAVLHWEDVQTSDGELALYNTNDFDLGSAMEDYLEWGSTDHMRSALAVSEGLWLNGDFVDYGGPFTFEGGPNDVGADYWSYIKEGCTYPEAENYDIEATVDDGSCLLAPENTCDGDLDGNNTVNTTDLLLFLSAYGNNCL